MHLAPNFVNVELSTSSINNELKGRLVLILISPHDRQHIEEHLGGCLDRLLQADGNMPAHLRPLVACLRAYVTRGGKRVRPQLCIWAFQNNSVNPVDSNLLDLACAWEIFHAFLLVHDDLIDVADTRRQIPSLHRQLQSLDHDSPLFGQNLAIVAGDLLFSVAIRLLSEMNIDPPRQVQLIRLFSRIACTTGFGQAIDLFQSQMPLAAVTEEVLLCEYDWKTAAYTFEGPLLSGAILAGAGPAVQSVLSRFSRAIGQAYQLQNDLQDLAEPAHEGCDLMQGKRTVSLMRARANMTPESRRSFDQRAETIATANGQAVRLAESLRLDLCASGAIEQTQNLIQRLLDEARSAAGSACVPEHFAGSLVGLVDSLQQHYFASKS
jgi:geranylgeranyl diphosphate synthase type I